MTCRTLFAAAAFAAILAGNAAADEASVVLKDMPGHEAVEQNCGSCHSLDYIPMNSPFLSAKLWEAEVEKMINAYGAPIEPPDAKAIIEYLARNYGVPG